MTADPLSLEHVRAVAIGLTTGLHDHLPFDPDSHLTAELADVPEEARGTFLARLAVVGCALHAGTLRGIAVATEDVAAVIREANPR